MARVRASEPNIEASRARGLPGAAAAIAVDACGQTTFRAKLDGVFGLVVWSELRAVTTLKTHQLPRRALERGRRWDRRLGECSAGGKRDEESRQAIPDEVASHAALSMRRPRVLPTPDYMPARSRDSPTTRSPLSRRSERADCLQEQARPVRVQASGARSRASPSRAETISRDVISYLKLSASNGSRRPSAVSHCGYMK